MKSFITILFAVLALSTSTALAGGRKSHKMNGKSAKKAVLEAEAPELDAPYFSLANYTSADNSTWNWPPLTWYNTTSFANETWPYNFTFSTWNWTAPCFDVIITNSSNSTQNTTHTYCQSGTNNTYWNWTSGTTTTSTSDFCGSTWWSSFDRRQVPDIASVSTQFPYLAFGLVVILVALLPLSYVVGYRSGRKTAAREFAATANRGVMYIGQQQPADLQKTAGATGGFIIAQPPHVQA